ncbi:GntR family transcriptional regulator [Fundicoccus culcitae]|uniref:GntR family transcriptional regulator n=1 Tax=Fundicoccus culcitae TaxID=2969821 RepID=A0ABY5PA26_9LACT|nr:GntR family transcriptional regulator [Fundicoccus culcitae]UUX35399.1 GntR family transcriptional regulator [Fundicoccus culcitae]
MNKTKYQVIADDLRNKILLKEYLPDEVIPSELQLQEIYDVSRHTVREAINLLVNEGYLRKKKGSGTYVDSNKPSNQMNHTTSKTIGVIITYMSDYIFPDIVRGIERTLRKHGYSMMLASTGNDYAQEKLCLEQMIKQGVQGLIVEPTKSNQFNPNIALYTSIRNNGIPVVMINANYEELDIPSIALNDVKSGFVAAEAVMEAGHKEILLVSKIDDLQGKLRMKGFFKACEKYKIDFNPDNILTYTTETRLDVAEKVFDKLKHNPNITAIVGYNDQIVYQIISLLNQYDIRIPEDISIVGNDHYIAQTINLIDLTTIEHPKEQLGMDAAEWVVEAVQTGKQNDSIFYQPKLIPGSTVKSLNS